MNIVVTGANGCLGRAVIKTVVEYGHNVIAVFRVDDQKLTAGSSLRSISMDFAHDIDTNKLPARCDVVIHLAQSRRFREFPEAALEVFRVNTATTIALANYALQAGASHFIYASSGTIYVPHEGPLPESAATAPSSFYAASKLAAEQLLAPFSDHMKVFIPRLFCLYGPGQKNMLVSNLACSLRNGTPIRLAGPDGPDLAPTYAVDVGRILATALAEGWVGVCNVASPHVVSLRALTETIGSVIGAEPRFEHTSDISPPGLVPELKKLAQYVDMNSFTDPASGLAATFSSEVVARGS